MARKVQEINAGSMADIAFLLLIFFLVTSTMDTDFGIARLLPPLEENAPPQLDIKKRNLLVVNINFKNELQVGGEVMHISQLKNKVKEFILNDANDANLPEKKDITVPYFGDVQVSKGVISLTNDMGTNYKTYVMVQNELTGAFNELRDKISKEKFGRVFEKLSDKQQDAVKKVYPMAISEAEPKNTGGGS